MRFPNMGQNRVVIGLIAGVLLLLPPVKPVTRVEHVMRYLERAEQREPLVVCRESYRLAWQVVRVCWEDRRRPAYEYAFWRMYGTHWLRAVDDSLWEHDKRQRLAAMRRAEWVTRKRKAPCAPPGLHVVNRAGESHKPAPTVPRRAA